MSASTSQPIAPVDPFLDAPNAGPLKGSSSHSPPTSDTEHLSWRLKTITWPDPRVGGDRREVKIICQSLNGPCSLISLCNVLILRGSIHIRRNSSEVSFEDLAQLIADFLVERPHGDSTLSIESALEILPTTVRGLNVNPSFAGVGKFEAQGAGGELALFELCGVHLTHGWTPDQSDARQSEVLQRVGTYDAAQMLLANAADAEVAFGKGSISSEQAELIDDAAVVRDFLSTTQTQLTVSGLFALNDSLQERDLVALFRSNHLSVLYKRPVDPSDPNGALLYSLVTDESLLREPEVIWESIGDVDQTDGNFVNSEFHRSAAAGGDFAGLTAEQAARNQEISIVDGSGGVDYSTDPADYDQQIARQLQNEEDSRAARHLSRQQERRQPSTGRKAAPTSKPASGTTSPKEKKEKKCIIM